MKFYVLGNDRKKCIAISNAANLAGNSCIIGEVERAGLQPMLGDAEEKIRKGTYDVVFLVLDNPQEVAIEANRMASVRAVACTGGDDAHAARRARANLLVVDPAGLTRTAAAEMVRAVSHGQGQTGSQQSTAMGTGRAGTPVRPTPGKGVRTLPSSAADQPETHDSRAQQRAPDDEQGEASQGPAEQQEGAGLVKRLKYIFGLD